MSKWIYFEYYPPKEGYKTSSWVVKTREGDQSLGLIKWLGRWRKYAFFPAQDTVYEPTCLQDIANFIKSEMDKKAVSG